MWKETDDKVAVPLIEEAKQRYPRINQCSFDKGYYSKDNVIALNQHSGVGACINNLEIRGLNRCLSHGRDGFERYVALSIAAINLHRIR